VRVHPLSRGVNIYVFDLEMNLLHSRAFDTYGHYYAWEGLGDYIDWILTLDNVRVHLITLDAWSRQMSGSEFAAIDRLIGRRAANPHTYVFRSSYTAVIEIKDGVRTVLDDRYAPRYHNPGLVYSMNGSVIANVYGDAISIELSGVHSNEYVVKESALVIEDADNPDAPEMIRLQDTKLGQFLEVNEVGVVPYTKDPISNKKVTFRLNGARRIRIRYERLVYDGAEPIRQFIVNMYEVEQYDEPWTLLCSFQSPAGADRHRSPALMGKGIDTGGKMNAAGIQYSLTTTNSGSYSGSFAPGYMQAFSWGSNRGWIEVPLPDGYNEVFIEYGAFNGGVRLWVGGEFIKFGSKALIHQCQYSPGDTVKIDESNMMDIKAIWVRSVKA
jgi:hypothetical protein